MKAWILHDFDPEQVKVCRRELGDGATLIHLFRVIADRGGGNDLQPAVEQRLARRGALLLDQVAWAVDLAEPDKTYLVLGKEPETDFTGLEKLGPVTRLSLEDIFGYKQSKKYCDLLTLRFILYI